MLFASFGKPSNERNGVVTASRSSPLPISSFMKVDKSRFERFPFITTPGCDNFKVSWEIKYTADKKTTKKGVHEYLYLSIYTYIDMYM